MFSKNYVPLSLFLMISLALATAQQQPAAWQSKHVGEVRDWTSRHIMVSGGFTAENLRMAQIEPRVLLQLGPRAIDPTGPAPRIPTPVWWHPPTKQVVIDGSSSRHGGKIDWSVSLGTGHVSQAMFPAKYRFDTGGTPSCTADYVVYALNVAGVNKGQPNIVGIDNLYSGNPSGLCGANPTVDFAYDGSTAGGSVLTSPVLSLDGTKIAYIESAASSSVFHILTWVAGQGTIAKSVQPGAPTCTAGANCLQSVTFSTTSTTTYASPWVDYGSDKGFVASDDGKIYRISCVFTCALNANPTVDWVFTLPVAGTGGALPQPNGPIYNSPYGYIFVGDQLGEIWAIDASGSTPTLLAGPVMVGGGGCTTTNPPGRTGTPAPCTATGTAYGIPDSAILDASGSSEKLFVFSGNDGAGAVVKQMSQTLTGIVRVSIGQGGVNIHTGTFDNNYWGATPTSGELFVCGTGPTDNVPYHYWIGFTNYPTINSTPTGSLVRLAGANGVACAPYTEFYNPNLNLGNGDHDLLVSGLIDPTNGYVITNDISTGVITKSLAYVNYPGGISGVVIDNDSTASQASSVYFSTLGTVNVGSCANQICAVKLTQSGLK
jgi:hypothetical protein